MLNCLSQAIITFVYFILPQVLILVCFFFNSLVAIKDKIAFVINAVTVSIWWNVLISKTLFGSCLLIFNCVRGAGHCNMCIKYFLHIVKLNCSSMWDSCLHLCAHPRFMSGQHTWHVIPNVCTCSWTVDENRCFRESRTIRCLFLLPTLAMLLNGPLR